MPFRLKQIKAKVEQTKFKSAIIKFVNIICLLAQNNIKSLSLSLSQ